MNRILVLALSIWVIGYTIYSSTTPELVKVNRQMVEQCTIDMQVNPDLVCD